MATKYPTGMPESTKVPKDSGSTMTPNEGGWAGSSKSSDEAGGGKRKKGD